MRFGYKLSSEEFSAPDLVRWAKMAEATGFDFAAISDHFHPWVDAQGQSPFVWSVLGAVAEATDTLEIGTAVTCPTVRIHPAIVAQAAATAAQLLPGRFFLGLGTGENLNEHILGGRWPNATRRRDRLREAIEVVRELWTGELVNVKGELYEVENARLYSLPDELPPILVAASGKQAAGLAGEMGDGLIGLAPDPKILDAFDAAGGEGKPRYAEINVCWNQDEAAARDMLVERWPNGGAPGELSAELPLPRHFEQIGQMLNAEDVAQKIPCGPDPERYLEAIRTYARVGYDHIWIHQIGPDQEGFFRFYAEQIAPRLGEVTGSVA